MPIASHLLQTGETGPRIALLPSRECFTESLRTIPGGELHTDMRLRAYRLPARYHTVWAYLGVEGVKGMLSIDQEGCATLLLHGSHRVECQGGLAAALRPKHLQEQVDLLK